ncbi:MAG: RHS repeat-associated core domain-containing protein, partial [Verrucomicrobiota bacterium]
TRTEEFGSTEDRQKANSKDEDPTGLLNEGFRYRDLEAGVFITRDPLGFVDGPNVYTYVIQNPWTKFDPRGLNAFAQSAAATPAQREQARRDFMDHMEEARFMIAIQEISLALHKLI